MIQAIFILLLVTLPLMYGLRTLLGKRVEAVMRRSSSQVKYEPSSSVDAVEVEAPTALEIRRLDSASEALQSDDDRHRGAASSRSLFRRWCLYDAATLPIALTVWQLAHWYHFQHTRYLDDLQLIWITLAYLAMIALRYLVYVRRYKNSTIDGTKTKGWIRSWVTVGPELLVRLYIDPRYAWYPLFFVLYTLHQSALQQGLLDSESFYAFNLFSLTAVLINFALRIHLDRLAQRSSNRSLLILRVFGRDENTTLTFGALRNYWQHIGSTFTVVDPSFIRYKYQSNSEQHLAIVFFATLAWVYIFGTPEFNEWWYIAPILGVLIVVGYALALIVLYIRAPNSFAASPQETKDRLQRFLRRPRRWDLTFKNFDLYGFANTWKDAVSQFILAADIVIMDLRGFSENNKGCETEIDLLYDTKPNDQLVFLVNTESDLVAVERTLNERWSYLRDDSPNLVSSPAAVTIYHSHDEGELDMKCLINLLYAGAISQSEN